MPDYSISPPKLDELRLQLVAEQLTLKTHRLSLLRPELQAQYSPIALAMHDHFIASERSGELLLPNLAAYGNESVGIFSDYAGESSGRYHTYSFLICAVGALQLFREQMAKVRRNSGLGDKEIAFKDFRMKSMQAALPGYLHALDLSVTGLLFTVVIDKRLVSVFGPAEKATCAELSVLLKEGGFGSRKARTAEKLARIVHCAAYVVGLLVHPGQKLFWMTDNDDIVPDATRHLQVLQLLQQVLPLYQTPALDGPLGGAVPFAERDLGTLDLLSAADVAASCVEHAMTQRRLAGAAANLKDGALPVLQWLGRQGIGLKKSAMLMEPGAKGTVVSKTLKFSPGRPPAGARTVPIVRPRQSI